MKKWTIKDIPSQKGKIVIVTGTGGLGLEDALALARAEATVIIAGRNQVKGQTAIDYIHAAVPDADVRFEMVDLADLASVSNFAQRMNTNLDRLDVLINNAGVMTPPERRTTKDGFELQFGTNYLSHFALTAHLLPLLKKTKGRVVTLSSIAARDGQIAFDNLQAERDYKAMPIYRQSKLACLMFAFELQRRSEAGGWGITSIAAHPGLSRTDLIPNGSGSASPAGYLRRFGWFLLQPVAQGTLPTLYAASSPDAKPGGYYGPHALRETRGYPTDAFTPEQAKDLQVANKLWEVSEELTSVTFA